MKKRISRPVEVLKSSQVKSLPGHVVDVVSADVARTESTESSALPAPGRRRRTGSARTGPAIVNLLFDVEQQALVAAERSGTAGRIGRTDRADIEPADAVFAAEEQLLENRQLVCVPVNWWMYSSLRAHAERHATGLALEDHTPSTIGL